MTLTSLKNKIFSINLANRTEGKKRYLFILELIMVAAVFVFSVILWQEIFKGGYSFSEGIPLNPDLLILGLFNLISWVILYRLTIIAKLPRTQRYSQIFFNYIRVAFLELVFLFIFKFAAGLHAVEPGFVLFYAGLNLFVMFHFRTLSYRIFKIFRARGHDLHHVVVIADSYSDIFIEKILNEKEWGFKIDKIFTDSKLIRQKFGGTIPVYSEKKNINKVLTEEVVDEVIYCKYAVDEQQVREITRTCNEIGVIFRLQSGFSPLENQQLQMETLNREDQLSLSDTPSVNLSLFFKKAADLYFSFFMLLFLAPVFLVIAVAIKIDSRGPVFFSQERVGLHGRRFRLFKFRTMVQDAEKVLDKLRDKNEVDGPVFKIKNDPRVTNVGRFLRKTGLDELPQFYNVFLGEMSLIGPRPPLPREVEEYKRWQLRRLSVKPGITCTWQVIPNRNDVSFEKWMKLDLQYIDNWSFGKDVWLFFKTVKTFFTAGGH